MQNLNVLRFNKDREIKYFTSAMIVLITGATHTGKTLLAQKLLEKYSYPYLSLDLLKMGLIRSKNTNLNPEDDEELIPYLWSIAKEIIKTAIENDQNLIVEGCYIPSGWEKDFSSDYLKDIRFICLVMSRDYIEKHFNQILHNANAIENRVDDSVCTKELLISDNESFQKMCECNGYDYHLIENEYSFYLDL